MFKSAKPLVLAFALILFGFCLFLGLGVFPGNRINPWVTSDAVIAGSTLGELVAKKNLVAFGKAAFEDTNLSLKRNMSCATCHSVKAGGTAANDLGNKLVGVHPGSIFQGFDVIPSSHNVMGFRNVQTNSYSTFSPPLQRIKKDGITSFYGGNFWDGRATGFFTGRPTQEQATQPPIGTLEGQLPSPACVVYRVLNPKNPNSYKYSYFNIFGAQMKDVQWPSDIEEQCKLVDGSVNFGKTRFPFRNEKRVQVAYNNIALAMMAYQGSDHVSPFSSKFDQSLNGKAVLNASEKRGMSLFNGKAKCASCHVSTPSVKGKPPLFTDFTYDNLGVPRNPSNPFYLSRWVNSKGKNWIDLGLGGFLQTQDSFRDDATDQIGKFKVPTVRNVDQRPTPDFVRAYMHNGYFKSLEQVVDFYDSRDVRPRCTDPFTNVENAQAQGCWPEPEYPSTVNRTELGNLKLSINEKTDLVAFLKSLSDRI